MQYSDLKKSNLKNLFLKFYFLSCYRPVSQLSSISKTLERVVSIQLINYITYNAIVDIYQSAYLPHRSTDTALTLIINDILISRDNKSPCYFVLLDLFSTFDTLDHNIIYIRPKPYSLAVLAYEMRAHC